MADAVLYIFICFIQAANRARIFDEIESPAASSAARLMR